MISIETIVEDGRWAEAGDMGALAARCFDAARGREPRLRGSAALLFADDATLADLNSRFRGKEGPTNVLSFPSGEAQGFLGDIAIAFETAAREAAEKSVALADHAAHLIVHGLLHLAGHDHAEEEEAETMEGLEAAILGDIGVANPYDWPEQVD